MIRISAVYPNVPGSRFDAGYYVGEHTRFVTALLGAHGLQSIRATIGTAAMDGGPPSFWAISEMIFTSREAFDAAMAASAGPLFEDVRRYTDVDPVLQLSVLHDPA